jgi:uncharacterized protein YjbI with pentapeptide repeats
MANELIFMKGREFVQKVLSGERDFSNIELEQDFDLSGYEAFDELQTYLKDADLEEKPLIVENSKFRQLDADGLYLPFIKANNANFKHGTFMAANFENGQFKNTDFRYAKLAQVSMKNSNLENSDLRQADLYLSSLIGTILTGADFSGASLQFTNMQAADVKRIKNLGLARFVETTNLQFAQLTEKEKSVIRSELWAQEGKKRRLFGGSG